MNLFDEADGAAYSVLAKLGFEDVEAPTPRALLRGMRATLSYRNVGPARGWCDYLRRRVHVEPSGDLTVEGFETAHEVGHLVGYDQGITCYVQDEFADAVAGKLLVPTRGIRSLVRRVGLSPPEILHRYPHAPASLVLARMGESTDTIAIVHVAGERRVYSCAYRLVSARLHGEDRLVADVREAGRPLPGPGGVVAWPFLDPGGLLGVVVLADLWGLRRVI